MWSDLSGNGHDITGLTAYGSFASDMFKCALLVGARYKVTVDDYFVYAKGKAKVSGYPTKLVDAEVIDVVKHLDVQGIPLRTA